MRHGTVGRRDQEHGSVHLRYPGDHVLDIIGVSWAVDVSIVLPLRFVLDVAGDDRQGLGGVSMDATSLQPDSEQMLGCSGLFDRVAVNII